MSIANGYGPNWTTAEGRAVDLQKRVVELEQQLAAAQAEISEWKEKDRHWELNSLSRIVEQRDAAQAEARNWKRIAEDATHVEREELARVREIVSGMREYADSCDHPSEASKRNAVEYWLAQLEGAISKPAEQHDPLAVSDHCGECGEPEPECACDERIEDHRESGQEGKE